MGGFRTNNYIEFFCRMSVFCTVYTMCNALYYIHVSLHNSGVKKWIGTRTSL